jgi:hypothetical protein
MLPPFIIARYGLNLLNSGQTYLCLGHCITRGIGQRRQATIFRSGGAVRLGGNAGGAPTAGNKLEELSRHLDIPARSPRFTPAVRHLSQPLHFQRIGNRGRPLQ